MNSKPKTEKIEITVGQRLLQVRETLGLSRESIAERLCLKVCTIREIEEDINSHSINPTFLRGYIRSYAKLVQITEKEILELLDKHTPITDIVVSPMQSYCLDKKRKKQEGWLIKITWLIIIICIIMIGIWWWQGYKVQKQEIAAMIKQNYSNVAQITSNSFSASPRKETRIKENHVNKLLIGTDILPATKSRLISEKGENKDVNINIKSVNSAEVKTVPLSDNIVNSNSEKLTVKETILSQ